MLTGLANRSLFLDRVSQHMLNPECFGNKVVRKLIGAQQP